MQNQVPHGPPNLSCPFHHKPMDKVCHRCPLWTSVRGRNPNTGEEVDQWNCAIAWLPMLAIETANQARSGAVATENFRNEMIKLSAPTYPPEVSPPRLIK